jgi:hypothetical protein
MVMIVVSQAFWRLPARKERLVVHPCACQPASQPHQRRILGDAAERAIRADEAQHYDGEETKDVFCEATRTAPTAEFSRQRWARWELQRIHEKMKSHESA